MYYEGIIYLVGLVVVIGLILSFFVFDSKHDREMRSGFYDERSDTANLRVNRPAEAGCDCLVSPPSSSAPLLLSHHLPTTETDGQLEDQMRARPFQDQYARAPQVQYWTSISVYRKRICKRPSTMSATVPRRFESNWLFDYLVGSDTAGISIHSRVLIGQIQNGSRRRALFRAPFYFAWGCFRNELGPQSHCMMCQR